MPLNYKCVSHLSFKIQLTWSHWHLTCGSLDGDSESGSLPSLMIYCYIFGFLRRVLLHWTMKEDSGKNRAFVALKKIKPNAMIKPGLFCMGIKYVGKHGQIRGEGWRMVVGYLFPPLIHFSMGKFTIPTYWITLNKHADYVFTWDTSVPRVL